MDKTVILLDGALGTNLWEMSGTNANTWELNITHPDIVTSLHKMYIEAGSEIITANTFSVNALSTKESPYSVKEVVQKALQLAKKARKNRNIKIALDIGPLTELLEPYGNLTEEECSAIYSEIIESAIDEKPDIIFFETFMDIEMLKLAVHTATSYNIPIFCSMTFTNVGKTIMGNSVEDMIKELSVFPIAAIGLNCSLDPTELMDVIKTFRMHTNLPLIFKPNAGLPEQTNGALEYHTDAQTFALAMKEAKELAPIYLGGCCGTKPNFINALRKVM